MDQSPFRWIWEGEPRRTPPAWDTLPRTHAVADDTDDGEEVLEDDDGDDVRAPEPTPSPSVYEELRTMGLRCAWRESRTVLPRWDWRCAGAGAKAEQARIAPRMMMARKEMDVVVVVMVVLVVVVVLLLLVVMVLR